MSENQKKAKSGNADKLVSVAQLKSVVEELVEAAVADSWKGAGHPSDWRQIEERYEEARARYEVIVERIEMALQDDIPY